MPIIESAEAFERYRSWARNSSHFVWFLANLRFFKAHSGENAEEWIFAYTRIGRVTLLALEPLSAQKAAPEDPRAFGASFALAWKQFCDEVKPEICAFVGIYTPFSTLLRGQGFQTLQVGQEPWVDLANCIPKGNAGKGVRAARNQALHAGLKVEEWLPKSLISDPARGATLVALYRAWKSRNLIHVGGFLNAGDPLAYCEQRRYFIARSREDRIEGFLIATPVAGIEGYFLEDLILRPDHVRGAGELLTLEAMIALGDSGAKVASLGVISVNSIDSAGAHSLPPPIRLFVVELPAFLRRFYNFDGLMTFRKRFKPAYWDNIHLAVENRSLGAVSDTRAWCLVLISLLLSFRPRVQLSWTWVKETLAAPWRKHPLSWAVGGISALLFAGVNHFGELPVPVLHRWGFTASAPLWEWFHRSIVSDFLYFDWGHILFCLVPFVILIRWAERCHRIGFLTRLLVVMIVVDDWVNYALIIQPFEFIRPKLFEQLLQNKDVGGSLSVAMLLGLQLCELRKGREIIFAGLALASVFGFVFASARMLPLIVDLNHFLFLTVGFVIGKLKYEKEREKSRAGAKAKPPESRSVAKSVLRSGGRGPLSSLSSDAVGAGGPSKAPEGAG